MARKYVVVGACIALSLAFGAFSACTDEDSGSGDGGSPNEAEQRDDPNRATDDYTPHVASGQPVIVDTLTWKVTGALQTQEIGTDVLAEKADGVFVVVDLSVKNGKDESVTINSDMIKLVAGDKTYETDSDGTFAAAGEGSESFLLKDLGPDVTTKGVAVFDVPSTATSSKPEVCFGELGFGESQGCIRLPAL